MLLAVIHGIAPFQYASTLVSGVPPEYHMEQSPNVVVFQCSNRECNITHSLTNSLKCVAGASKHLAPLARPLEHVPICFYSFIVQLAVFELYSADRDISLRYFHEFFGTALRRKRDNDAS
jgi:hypothetical protein